MRLFQKFVFFVLLLSSFLLFSCQIGSDPQVITTTTTTTCYTDWTVMMYIGGDSTLTSALLDDLCEIKSNSNNNMRVVALVDVGPKGSLSQKFGTVFEGVKLFLITKDNATMLSGKDILPQIKEGENDKYYYGDTGDAHLLKSFIQYCKKYYPSKKYALIFGGHGYGVEEKQTNIKVPAGLSKSMIPDDSSDKDVLFTAELTDVLTEEESVDLMIIDCCLMGYAEILYQYRPGNGSFNTKYLLASSTRQIEEGFAYDQIFSKVTPTMSEIDFGKLILNEQQAYIQESCKYSWLYYSITDICVFGLYDLSKIATLKNSIDSLVPMIISKEFISDFYQDTLSSTLGYNNKAYYYYDNDIMYDGYDFFTKLSECNELTTDIRNKCTEIAQNFEDITIMSFMEKNSIRMDTFEPNKNGLAFFAPMNVNLWNNNIYYNAIDPAEHVGVGYGKMSWCIDGCEMGNNIPENWFELLDYWFDSGNDEYGGNNYYQY